MTFKTHELSEKSTLQGMVLSVVQKQVIENRVAELSAEILNYPASQTDERYFERLNFQKGQLQELVSMLTASDEAEQQLNATEGN